jgi:polar amino acid transport system substrate-binding protein
MAFDGPMQKEEETVSAECQNGRLSGAFRTATIIAVTGVLALVGCAKNNDTVEANNDVSKCAEKFKDIPTTMPVTNKDAGTLIVGTNPPYKPNEFKDETGKLVGFDIDLTDAVAAELGYKTDYRESSFDTIIPSIEGCNYDLGVSSFTDNKEREKTVDFVTYFSAGSSWAQRTGAGIDPDNACGKKVAVQSKTVQETDELPAKNKKCTDAGKPAIQVVPFDSQDLATNAVVLGQADAMSADSPVTAYAIKANPGKLEAAGVVFDSAPYGWPVAKKSKLADAMVAALKSLIANGKYKEIAAKWGLEGGMITEPQINGATS